MAKPLKSTKTVKAAPKPPFTCTECGETKLPTLFPSLDAKVCSVCASKREDPSTTLSLQGALPPASGEVSANAAASGELFSSIPVEIDPQNPTHKELAARTVAQRHLLPFIQRFRQKYQAGWVHKDICRRLERFVKQVEEKKEPRLLLCMPVRMGKLLADDTPVLTANRGWTNHGDLRVGDAVFGPDGKSTKVLSLSEKGEADVLVTMSDGSEIQCHENHEWTVYQRNHRGENKFVTVETNYWLEKNEYGAKRALKSSGRHIYQLPKVLPLEYDCEVFTIHPYVLGAWLGGGSVGKPCVSWEESDKEILEAIVGFGYKASATCKHKTTGVLTTCFSGDNKSDAGLAQRRKGEIQGRMSQELMALGIFNEKRIPESYNYLSVTLRLELLAGLIDTGGSVDKSGRVHITTVSDALRDDIAVLIRSFGVSVGCHTQPPRLSTSGIQGRKPTHYISFTPAFKIPTKLPRKKIVGNRQESKAIVDVKRVAPKIGRCIQVERGDGLYLAGKQLTPTHNSEIGSRHFVPWVIGKHPEWEIIAASGAQSLAISFSRYIRDLMLDQSYTSVFPSAKLDPKSQSVEVWNTTAGGGYLAAGVGTMITGRGAHILLIDDAVKDAEAADSQTIRDNIWEWYISTALSRLAPGGGVLVIMTLWNEDDLGGRLINLSSYEGADKFEIVKYPAINDQGDEYILLDDTIVQIPPGHDVPEGAKLTRPQNSALHPERYTLESLLKRKATYYAQGQQRWWAALYQQNPTPEEGAYFTKDMFRYYVNPPHKTERNMYQAWDFAITESQQGDYVVGSCAEQDHLDNLYFTDVMRFKSSDSYQLVDSILDFWVMHGSEALVGVEDGQIWKSIEAVFRRRCEERRLYPSIEVLKPYTDKFVRAQPLRGRMQQGKVWFQQGAPWLEDLRNEFLRFGAGGKHDDQVDSCSWATRLSLLHAAPRLTKPPEPKSWKDKLGATFKGRGGGHMAA